MSGKWKTDPVSKRTVDRLCQESIALNDGDFMGAEEELCTRYGVSRPTLRLAAGIASQDQLVRVRRGVNGGYFAARPTAGAVARVASIFLSANGANIEDLLGASTPIRIGIARLAALSKDPLLRSQLEPFLEEEDALMAEPFDYAAFIRADRRFWTTLGAACGNSVLQLFMNILLSLVRTVEPSQDPVAGNRERLQGILNRRRQVVQAILDGDADMAALAAQRSTVDADITKHGKLTAPSEAVNSDWNVSESML